MSEFLVLTLGPDGSLHDQAPHPEVAGADAVLVIPGTQVTSLRVAMPDFPDAKLMKVLPGLLDGGLALAQEERHFALVGPREKETGDRIVAVMAKADMQAALDVCCASGHIVRRLVPDYMVLPVPEEGALALRLSDRVLVRRSDGTGFTAEADLAEAMLAGEEVQKWVPSEEYEDLLSAAPSLEINLLQGSFSPRDDAGVWLQRFSRAGLLAAASLLIWIGTTLYTASDNMDRTETLYAKAEARFREALPDVGRIVNLEAQMRQAVQSVRKQEGGEFLILSSLASQALAQDDNTVFESMRFDGTQSSLMLAVSFGSFSEAEAYKARLSAAGLAVIEGGSRTEGARIVSELTIRRRV